MNAVDSMTRRPPSGGMLAAAVALCAALGAAAPGAVHAQQAGVVDQCGSLRNHYGPYDYRVNRGETLENVEKYHFTPNVENLLSGITTTTREMAADVGYTLRAFPNHHRALLAMMRLGERHKADMPPAATYTVECYFIRGIRFAHDDTVVRGLYAQYLIKHNRKDDAIRQLEAAATYAADNPLSHYNIGLLYFDLGKYDRSLEEAHKAQALGLQRTDLAQMLKRVNKWQEPAE